MPTFRSKPVQVHAAYCSYAMLLCALSLSALPQHAQAQQASLVSENGNLPRPLCLSQTQPNSAPPEKAKESEAKAGADAPCVSLMDAEAKVTLDVNNVPLSAALKRLFAQAKMKRTLVADSKLINAPVTAHFKNVGACSALEQLLKSTGTRLSFGVVSGVYQILPQRKAETENAKP